MGFGLIGLFGLLGSAIGASVENSIRMDRIFGYTKDGEPIRIDRLGNKYINGEKVVSRYNYILERTQEVGVRSGKVYFDSVENKNDLMAKRSEESKKRQLELGKLSYDKWHPQYGATFTTEISTDKIIAVLLAKEYIGIYRKFYYEGNEPINHLTMLKEAPGDFGIPITKEEYKGLKQAVHTYSSCPEYETMVKIGTPEDPYYNVKP